MNRKKIAAGNWKMNTSVSEGLELYKQLSKEEIPEDVVVIVAPPATHLYALQSNAVDNIKISAQNCHQEENGAFTGEISPTTLKEMGLDYVILGHSERREYAGEENALLKKKLDTALAAGLNVIFCCGESLDIRKAGNQNAFVENQLRGSVFHLSEDKLANVIIAYEPIWAIGTGETASPEQAQEMHKHLRGAFSHHYGATIANRIPILYGGSVKPTNAKDIFCQEDVDGGLVGGASLKADSFGEIIRSFQ